MARMAAGYLSKELQTEVRIRGFDLSLKKGLLIRELSVLDLKHDTLLSATEIGLRPGKFSLRNRTLNINKIFLENTTFQLITHRGDTSMNLQFILDYFASADTTASDTSSRPWKISAGALAIANARFRLHDENLQSSDPGMDYSNLDIRKININLEDIHFDELSIHANVRQLEAHDRCGFVLKQLSGSVQVGPRFLKMKSLILKTGNSNLSGDLEFLYNNWSAYIEFVDSVLIRANFNPSELELSDIGYFAPDLFSMTDRISIAGSIKGTISNFKARNLKLGFGQNTRFSGNLNMLGLPDISETFTDLHIKNLTTDYNDLANFRLPGGPENKLVLPEFLKSAGVIRLSGIFTGFMNDFAATANLKSDIGTVKTDLSMKTNPAANTRSYKGNLECRDLDLGAITDNQELLGKITCRGALSGTGFTPSEAELMVDIKIDTAVFNNYAYKDASLSGMLSAGLLDGKFNIQDENLDLVFDGSVDIRDTIPKFDFRATVNHANLFKINLLKRDSVTGLSTSLDVNFSGRNLDELSGDINIKNTTYFEGNRTLTMDRLSLLTKENASSGKSYHLASDFIDGEITGNFSFTELIPSLENAVRHYLGMLEDHDSANVTQQTGSSNLRLQMKAELKQTDELTAVFLPFLKISPGSIVEGSFDQNLKKLKIHAKAASAVVAGYELNDWFLDAESHSDHISAATGAREFFLVNGTPQDSVQVRLDSLLVLSDIRHDSIIYNLTWSSQSRKTLIGGVVNLIRNPEIETRFTDFDVYIQDKYWSVNPLNKIIIRDSIFDFTNLEFISGDQHLKINGILSERDSDTLTIDFNKVDISKIDRLTGQSSLDFDGILSGKLQVINPFKNLVLLSDLRIDKFKFNGELLGDATFKVRFNNEKSRFDILSSILYTGKVGTNTPFTLNGNVIIEKQNPVFDFDLHLKNLNLKMFNPFVRDFMSGISGFASGNVKIKGNITKPLLSGELQFMRSEFKINYLNVPYSFADVIKIDTGSFLFNNIAMYDSLGNKAVLNGKITHQYFQDLTLDLHAEMNDFAVFNNTRAQNNIFYGKARATGIADITGPVENLRIDVKASNGGKTQVTIPIDLTQSVSQADYIIFVEPGSDTLGDPVKRINPNAGGLSLDLAMRVKEDAEVEVFFPEQLGNLKASGTGELSMTMTPATPFSLSGTYRLTKGFFLFTLKNYLRLPMSLGEGSSIGWAGDPTDANVSITAVYKTKVPLKGITTEPNLEATRIQVECIIRLKGKLMNPEISFGLRLPNAEEAIKNQVFSAIDTNNAVVMADQTIYLLVLNQFKPVVGTSTEVDMSGTAISMVTNQLNSMISRLSSNVSVNMNYKPGTSTTSQEFDVGISTQLFNDRLLIDGTFGMNSGNESVQQTSTIVGDINIEYVLTDNRRWRVRAFNRTNTTSLLNNNAPYTQGVGLKYQRDFSNFKELFTFGKKGK